MAGCSNPDNRPRSGRRRRGRRKRALRAARFHARRDVRVETVPDPAPPAPGEVLLAPRACGICGTDVHEYADGPAAIPTIPHPLTGASAPQILGHEFAGEVVAVGDGVRHVRAGDRVAVMPLHFCGRCEWCLTGLELHCSSLAVTGFSFAWGGLAELALVPGHQAVALPDELTFEQGALVEPAAVAVSALDRADPRPGANVLVTGGGPIGALVAYYALACGCAVFVSEPSVPRAGRLAALGFTLLDPGGTDVAEQLRELTEGYGIDAAIECAGSSSALADCVASVRPRGFVVQVGLHHAPASVDVRALTRREVRLVGSWCYPLASFSRAARLISSGLLPAEAIAGALISLEEVVPQGLEALLDQTSDVLKILVSPSA